MGSAASVPYLCALGAFLRLPTYSIGHHWLPTSAPGFLYLKRLSGLRNTVATRKADQECHRISAPKGNPQPRRDRNSPVSLPLKGLIPRVGSIEFLRRCPAGLSPCCPLQKSTQEHTAIGFIPSTFSFPHLPTPFPNKLTHSQDLISGLWF
jgi:hypothetical protein